MTAQSGRRGDPIVTGPEISGRDGLAQVLEKTMSSGPAHAPTNDTSTHPYLSTHGECRCPIDRWGFHDFGCLIRILIHLEHRPELAEAKP